MTAMQKKAKNQDRARNIEKQKPPKRSGHPAHPLSLLSPAIALEAYRLTPSRLPTPIMLSEARNHKGATGGRMRLQATIERSRELSGAPHRPK
ncbi:MAG: hypothetical protein QNJ53_27125 [Pleurocapsa sp. MO_192.B19]|nr:hypothetical protein [Pleurocapsa sp. MO_192.B19]